MTYILIFLYALLSFMTLVRIKKIDLHMLSFSDGLLVGLVFYIAIPMFFVLASGEVFSAGIMLPAYQPYVDIYTTLNIYIGWVIVLLLHLFSSNRATYTARTNSLYLLKLMLFLYVIFSIYSYIKSGMNDANSHWHENLVSSLSSSTSLIIIKNFSFAYRTMIFGLIYYVYRDRKIDARKAIIIGGCIVVFDMFLTFNRITLVYFYFLFLLVFIRYWRSIGVFTACLLPVAMLFSNFWAVFRASRYGGGLTDIVNAVYIASEIFVGDIPFIAKMNGVFESSNIVVLNYVVKNIGGEFPALWGATFIVRPLTTFLPSSIWSEKPKVFGTYLGKYINNHETLTLNSTLFGEVIGNFYYFWPFTLFVVLYFINKLFNYFGRFLPATGFMAFFVAIGLWRFDMNFTSTCVYALVFLFLFELYISKMIAR